MRISESKCFSWHGLCLPLQGITRSLGGRDMQRVEVPTGQARMASGTSSDQHNRRALRAEPGQPGPLLHVCKSTVTLLGREKGRNSHPAGQAGAGISPLWEWSQRKKKCFWVWVQLFDPLLERAQLEGQAVPFRPAFLQNWPLIYAADMQFRCCYGAFTYSAYVCLLSTLHLLSVLQSLQKDSSKEYVEKVPWMPQCPFSCSVIVDAGKEGFVLHFHFLVKICLCFVQALFELTFSLTYHSMFLWDFFFLWKQYLCTFLQSQTFVFRNSMKVCQGRIYL